MSSNTYKQYSVFTAEVSGVQQSDTADDLFGHGSTVIIVMAQSYANNVYPRMPSWKIEFIGPVSEFKQNYVEKTAYYFDDGLNQSPLAKNGNGFRKLMDKLYAQAKPITAADLNAREFEAYSWDKSDFEHITDKARKTPVKWYGRSYYADLIQDDEDALRMVAEALEVKHGYPESEGDYRIDKTWLGRPSKQECRSVYYSRAAGAHFPR